MATIMKKDLPLSTNMIENTPMRLSTRSEYACLALIDLAERYGEGWVRIEDIARRGKIPRKYLEAILLTLRKAGYLESRRGVSGGYALAKAPGRISVAEVIRLMDGPLAPVKSVSRYFFAHTPSERSRPLLKLLKEVRDVVAAKMERTTLESLARG